MSVRIMENTAEQAEMTTAAAVKLETQPEKLIIVTGFGPFIGHEDINASWEAVRLLPDVLDFAGTRYKLEKQMIDVEYEAVDQAVSQIWARQPELVIHCGVHGAAPCVLIEKLAYNHKFRRADYAGKKLAKGSACLQNCPAGSKDNNVLHCGLDVNKIVSAIAASCECVPSASNDASANALAKVSKNVGDYLCGYIFLKSLDMNRNRSLFVHVPPVDKPLSSSQTSDVILAVVRECVRQVVEGEVKDTC